MSHHAGSFRALALSLAAFVAGTLPAAASLVTYQVFNHPDGGAIQTSVDVDGYVLRLDHNGVHTFNANTDDGVFFSFDTSDGNTAKLHGTVKHNQSGQLWSIEALFADIDIRAERAPWYSSTSAYDDMIADLLSHANFPDTADEQSIVTTDVDRIYFRRVELNMTLLSGGPAAFMGPTHWDEHPDEDDDPNSDKFFYLQYRWRLWDPEFAGEEHLIGAAGWLEPASGPDMGRNFDGSQDFLFVIGERVPVPEPGTTLLLLVAGTGLAFSRRRRR